MTAETRDLTGTVVLISGATSGIGRATARELVGAGANVALTGRRSDRLTALADELGADRVVTVAGDIADPDTSTKLVKTALDTFGRIDSVVASAGIGAYGGILELDEATIREMSETNYLGTVWSIRAALPSMLAAGGGDIVVVASVAGLRGGGHEPLYAATKFAQVGLAGAIDRELREKGMRVITIAPAAVSTEFAMGAGRSEGDAWLADVMKPEDVAAAIAYSLAQPRRLRTQLWSMWSMVEGS